MDLLLKDGTVITSRGHERVDVGIKDEVISSLAPDLPANEAEQVIDVSGKLLLPGVIDVHVHPVYTDDIEGCSRVAAYGGTTTLLHFAYARQGQSLYEETEKMLADGRANSRLDFGLHAGMFDAPRHVPEIPHTMELGVRTFKFFMPYIKQGWTTDDYQFLKAMDMLADSGGMAMVHAENGGGVDYLEDKYLTGPDASAELFNLTRPAALEEEATFRALRLAEVANCPLYIVHVTTARSLPHIKAARQAGQIVYAETCAHYLTLTKEIIKTHGALAKVGPPIRTEEDRLALWQAMRDNTLQVVSSDHAAKIKDPDSDFLEQGFGSPQLETLFPLTYDEGINKGRISLVRLTQILSENPARIFGLYPKKGTIAIGSDADILVLDPNREFTITPENQHSNVGYTLYGGRTILGWPELTLQRGHPVLQDGEIVAQPGEGQFLQPELKRILV